MINIKKLYQHPEIHWNLRECERAAKHIATDGLGTPYPWPGYIGNHFGPVLFNGGCVYRGDWYPGEHRELPLVHKNFEIIHVPTWGYRIVRT